MTHLASSTGVTAAQRRRHPLTLEEPPHRLPRISAPHGGWLLVLGRQANVRTLLVTFLGEIGYPVVGCATLAEAASALEEQAAPAVILFDGEAAPEDALHDQLHQLSALLPPTAFCPVLLLSLAQPLPRPSQLPGSVTVVAQPFDLTELQHRIATVSASAPPNARRLRGQEGRFHRS